MPKLKKSFVPKARLIQILGEHLIKDATVGVMELIKNSYDADATSVSIEMYDINKPNARIVIRDNGSGMDDDTFLNKWMNPATGHKERQKENKKRTQLGRLPLGEKGVGRFAAQQIGDELRMISKVKDSDDELTVDINWRIFEDYNKNLSDVEIEYSRAEAKSFSTDQSGTIIEIKNLKTAWTETDIKRISNTLKRMKSPFKGANDFGVTLSFSGCPNEFEKYKNLELSDILSKAHYKLLGLVDDAGIMEFEYDFSVSGLDRIHRTDRIDLKFFGWKEDEKVKCGGFLLNFHHYNKKKEDKWLQVSGLVSKDIDELCGVSVYRDGMRVLPYGEKGNDWLKLDNERVQDSSFIGNDTIIGLVEINQTVNNVLKDKTNREGLIENEAYHQFECLVFNAVRVLHLEKYKDRPKKKRESPGLDIAIEENIDNIKAKINEITQKASNSPDERIKQFAKELKQSEAEARLDEIKKQHSQSIEGLESRNKNLFYLAGTGLAAERFTHEFARLVSGANDSLERLRNELTPLAPRVKRETDLIGATLEALRNDIRLLGPMFYIRKAAKEKDLDIRQIIDNTLLLQENAIKKENIKIDVMGDSFQVHMREGSCMQIFNNLIDNAVYWLSKKSEQDDKKIKITIDSKTNSIYMSDNGPGVVPRYQDKIFDPFFSMKAEEGRGLGLYIVKEILEEKKWDIMLVNQDDYPGLLRGATFKIIFGNAGEQNETDSHN